MDKDHYRLYWKDQLIGVITNVGWSDFPWVGGDFTPAPMDSKLRKYLELLHNEALDDDEEPDELLFQEAFSTGWSIERPDGSKTKIFAPMVDFAEGWIEWR
ncbi:MAG: hypothetical protein AAF485_12320 [Chloroflexota bacterium]